MWYSWIHGQLSVAKLLLAALEEKEEADGKGTGGLQIQNQAGVVSFPSKGKRIRQVLRQNVWPVWLEHRERGGGAQAELGVLVWDPTGMALP